MLAHLALAAGDLDGMRAELAEAESLDRTWGLEMRALFATLPFVPASETELRDVRDALERWDPAEAGSSAFLIFAMHNDLHPAIRVYLLGLLELRLGDLAAAAEWLEALAELEASGPLVRNLTVELDAALAHAQGADDGGAGPAGAGTAGALVPAHGRVAVLHAGVAAVSPGAVAGGGRARDARRRGGTGRWRSGRRMSWCMRGRRWKGVERTVGR